MYNLIDDVPFYTAEEIDLKFSNESIIAERERATAAEEALDEKITNETTAREEADNTLSQSITDKVAAEATERQDADNNVLSTLRGGAEDTVTLKSLSDAVAAEITAREEAVTNIDNRVTTNTASIADNTSSIEAEVTRATAAEENLQQQINSAAIDEKIDAVTELISNETIAREEADNNLSQSIIDSINTLKGGSDLTIAQLKAQLEDLDARFDTVNNDVTTKILAESNAREEEDTNLTARIDSIINGTDVTDVNLKSLNDAIGEIRTGTGTGISLDELKAQADATDAEVTAIKGGEDPAATNLNTLKTSIEAIAAGEDTSAINLNTLNTEITAIKNGVDTSAVNLNSINDTVTQIIGGEDVADVNLATLKEAIDAFDGKIGDVDLVTLQGQLNDEITRATEAEAANAEAIIIESTRATTAEMTIAARSFLCYPSYSELPTVTPDPDTGLTIINNQLAYSVLEAAYYKATVTEGAVTWSTFSVATSTVLLPIGEPENAQVGAMWIVE